MLRIEDGHRTTRRHRGALVDNRRLDFMIDKIVMPGPGFIPSELNKLSNSMSHGQVVRRLTRFDATATAVGTRSSSRENCRCGVAPTGEPIRGRRCIRGTAQVFSPIRGSTRRGGRVAASPLGFHLLDGPVGHLYTKHRLPFSREAVQALPVARDTTAARRFRVEQLWFVVARKGLSWSCSVAPL